MQTPEFGFERLAVYQRAVEFLGLSVTIISDLPRGLGFLADQLKRAALSIPANIAEGAGRLTSADRRRHYGIARGSAMECVAILDAFRAHGVGNAQALAAGRSQLFEIVCMLTSICRPHAGKTII